MSEAKSKALNRKKEESETSNQCQHCSSKKHKTSEHYKKHKIEEGEKEELETEREEEKEGK